MRTTVVHGMARLLLSTVVLLSVAGSSSASTAFRSASFKTGTAAGSGAVTEPTGCVSGDVEVALALTDGAATSLTRPGGWSNLYNGTATAFDYDISYVVRGGSAPSLTWAWTGSVYYEVHIVCVSGANATPIDATSTLASGTGNRQLAVVDPNAITVNTANAMAVAVGVHWSGSFTGWNPPTGYALRSDNTAGNDGMVATKQLVSTGTEDPDGFDETSTADGTDAWIAVVVALKEAGAGGGGTTTAPRQLLLGVGGV